MSEDSRRDSGVGSRDSIPSTLDDAIDVVAREMTSAEAPAWLRVRVLEQIASPRTPRWTDSRMWVWAGAGAVLVLAVAGSVWILQPERALVPASQQVTAPAGTAGTAVTAAPAEMNPSATVQASASVAPSAIAALQPRTEVNTGTAQPEATEAGPVDAGTTTAPPESPVFVDMLSDPDPISIGELSIAPVDIATLSITELRVAPLEPDGAPNKR